MCDAERPARKVKKSKAGSTDGEAAAATSTAASIAAGEAGNMSLEARAASEEKNAGSAQTSTSEAKEPHPSNVWKCARCHTYSNNTLQTCHKCAAFRPAAACFVQPTAALILRMYDGLHALNRFLGLLLEQAKLVEAFEQFDHSVASGIETSAKSLLETLQILETRHLAALADLNKEFYAPTVGDLTQRVCQSCTSESNSNAGSKAPYSAHVGVGVQLSMEGDEASGTGAQPRTKVDTRSIDESVAYLVDVARIFGMTLSQYQIPGPSKSEGISPALTKQLTPQPSDIPKFGKVLQALQAIADIRSAFHERHVQQQINELGQHVESLSSTVNKIPECFQNLYRELETVQSIANDLSRTVSEASSPQNSQNTTSRQTMRSASPTVDGQVSSSHMENAAQRDKLRTWWDIELDQNLSVARIAFVAALHSIANLDLSSSACHVKNASNEVGRMALLQAEPSDSWMAVEQSWRLGSKFTGCWIMAPEGSGAKPDSKEPATSETFTLKECRTLSLALLTYRERTKGLMDEMRKLIALFVSELLPVGVTDSPMVNDPQIEMALGLAAQQENQEPTLGKRADLSPLHNQMAKIIAARSQSETIVDLSEELQASMYRVFSLFDTIIEMLNGPLSTVLNQVIRYHENVLKHARTKQKRLSMLRQLIVPYPESYSTNMCLGAPSATTMAAQALCVEWCGSGMGRTLQTTRALLGLIASQIEQMLRIRESLIARKAYLASQHGALASSSAESMRLIKLSNFGWNLGSNLSVNLGSGADTTALQADIDECTRALTRLQQARETVEQLAHHLSASIVAIYYSASHRTSSAHPASKLFIELLAWSGALDLRGPNCFQLMSLPEVEGLNDIIHLDLQSRGVLYRADFFPYAMSRGAGVDNDRSSDENEQFDEIVSSPVLQLVRNALAMQLNEDIQWLVSRAPSLGEDMFASVRMGQAGPIPVAPSKRSGADSALEPLPCNRVVKVLAYGPHVLLLRRLPEFGSLLDITIRARSHKMLFGLPNLCTYLGAVEKLIEHQTFSQIFPFYAVEAWCGLSPPHCDIPPALLHSAAYRIGAAVAQLHAQGLAHGNLTWTSFEFQSLGLDDLSVLPATSSGQGHMADDEGLNPPSLVPAPCTRRPLAEDFQTVSGGVPLTSLRPRTHAHPLTHFASPFMNCHMEPAPLPPTIFSPQVQSESNVIEMHRSDTFSRFATTRPHVSGKQSLGMGRDLTLPPAVISVESAQMAAEAAVLSQSHWSLPHVSMLRPLLTSFYWTSPVKSCHNEPNGYMSSPIQTKSAALPACPKPHPIFAAPEVHYAFEHAKSNSLHAIELSQKSDVWSIGLLLYYIYLVAPLSALIHARVQRRLNELRSLKVLEEFSDMRRRNLHMHRPDLTKGGQIAAALDGLLAFPQLTPAVPYLLGLKHIPDSQLPPGSAQFYRYWDCATSDLTLTSKERMFSIIAECLRDDPSSIPLAQSQVPISSLSPVPWPPQLDYSRGRAIVPTLTELALHPETALILAPLRGIGHVLSVIQACLQFNPKDRPTLEDILRSPLFGVGGASGSSAVLMSGARLSERTLAQIYTVGPQALFALPRSRFFGSCQFDREQLQIALCESDEHAVVNTVTLEDVASEPHLVHLVSDEDERRLGSIIQIDPNREDVRHGMTTLSLILGEPELISGIPAELTDLLGGTDSEDTFTDDADTSDEIVSIATSFDASDSHMERRLGAVTPNLAQRSAQGESPLDSNDSLDSDDLLDSEGPRERPIRPPSAIYLRPTGPDTPVVLAGLPEPGAPRLRTSTPTSTSPRNAPRTRTDASSDETFTDISSSGTQSHDDTSDDDTSESELLDELYAESMPSYEASQRRTPDLIGGSQINELFYFGSERVPSEAGYVSEGEGNDHSATPRRRRHRTRVPTPHSQDHSHNSSNSESQSPRRSPQERKDQGRVSFVPPSIERNLIALDRKGYPQDPLWPRIPAWVVFMGYAPLVFSRMRLGVSNLFGVYVPHRIGVANARSSLPFNGVFTPLPVAPNMEKQFGVATHGFRQFALQAYTAWALRYHGGNFNPAPCGNSGLFLSNNGGILRPSWRMTPTPGRKSIDDEAFFASTVQAGVPLTYITPENLYQTENSSIACLDKHCKTVRDALGCLSLISSTPLNRLLRHVHKEFSSWRLHFAAGAPTPLVFYMTLASRQSTLQGAIENAKKLGFGHMYYTFRTSFEGETGVDMGGVTLDFYTEVFTQAALPFRRLFESCDHQLSNSDDASLFHRFSHSWLLGPADSVSSLLAASNELGERVAGQSMEYKATTSYVHTSASKLPLLVRSCLAENKLLPYGLSRLAFRAHYAKARTGTKKQIITKEMRFEYLSTLQSLGKLLARSMFELSPIQLPLHPAVIHFLLMPALLPRPQLWNVPSHGIQKPDWQSVTRKHRGFRTPHLLTSLLWRELDLLALSQPTHRRLLELTPEELESLELDFSELPIDVFELLSPAVAQRLLAGLIPPAAFLAVPLPDCPPVVDWAKTSYSPYAMIHFNGHPPREYAHLAQGSGAPLRHRNRLYDISPFNGDPTSVCSTFVEVPKTLPQETVTTPNQPEIRLPAYNGLIGPASVLSNPHKSTTWTSEHNETGDHFEPSIFLQFKAQLEPQRRASAEDLMPYHSAALNWMPQSWVMQVGESRLLAALQHLRVTSQNVRIYVELLTAADLFVDRWDELCALRDGFQLAVAFLPMLRCMDLYTIAEWFGKGNSLPISRVVEIFKFDDTSWGGQTSTREDFLHIVEHALTDTERRQLLRLCTSLSTLPFGEKTTVEVVRVARTDALPVGHTCFKTLDLPDYNNYDVLLEKLRTALRNVDAAGFGYA